MCLTSSLRNTVTTSCRDGKMSVSLAKFYKMRGSLSSGEYPLFTSGQNLTHLLISSATVKYAKGLQTKLTVPAFTGWDIVNIVELDGQYYWVTLSKESTTYNGSVEFTLDYMGPTSFFRSGASVKGIWNRTPTNKCTYMKDNIMNDYMIVKSTNLTTLDLDKSSVNINGDSHVYAYWVQITGYDSNGDLKQYGGFVGYNAKFNGFDYVQIQGSGVDLVLYPLLEDLISNIGTYTEGLDVNGIIDFSISKRCPYKYQRTTGTASTNYQNYCYKLLDAANDPLTPDIGPSGYKMYRIDNKALIENTATVTITPTDMDRHIGSLDVRDWNNNVIANIPMLSSSVAINIRVHSDWSGIYTIMQYSDAMITVPEGKLPYIQNNYDTYRAYQMDTDRQVMLNAINNARYQRETDQMVAVGNTVVSTTSGLAMGMLTGNIASASLGAISGLASGVVNAYEADRNYELTNIRIKQDFELSKKKALNQPQSNYNVAYGLIYCAMNEINTLRIVMSEPNNIDNAYYTSWRDNFGYPAEGLIDLTISNGYYQGKLISDDYDKSGMYWDECNKTFMQGFKFIDPEILTYASKVVKNVEGYATWTFYNHIRCYDESAYYYDTLNNKYDTLMVSENGSLKFLCNKDSSYFGTTRILLFDVTSVSIPTTLVLDTFGYLDVPQSGESKTYAGKTPNDLNEIINLFIQ